MPPKSRPRSSAQSRKQNARSRLVLEVDGLDDLDFDNIGRDELISQLKLAQTGRTGGEFISSLYVDSCSPSTARMATQEELTQDELEELEGDPDAAEPDGEEEGDGEEEEEEEDEVVTVRRPKRKVVAGESSAFLFKLHSRNALRFRG